MIVANEVLHHFLMFFCFITDVLHKETVPALNKHKHNFLPQTK